MKSHDLHGLKVSESEALFMKYLNEARVSGKIVEVNFITGTGKIQERLKKLALENDLNSYVPLSNRGCIVVEFE